MSPSVNACDDLQLLCPGRDSLDRLHVVGFELGFRGTVGHVFRAHCNVEISAYEPGAKLNCEVIVRARQFDANVYDEHIVRGAATIDANQADSTVQAGGTSDCDYVQVYGS